MNDKYVEANRLLDQCVAAAADPQECTARAKTLMQYIRTNFPAAPREGETGYEQMLDCVRLLRNGKIDVDRIRAIPSGVPDCLYGLAMMRVAGKVYNLPIEPSALGVEFDLFHANYSHLITHRDTL